MLAIRLSRQGTRKKPFYRVVLLEKSAARNGRSLEILGTYNPVPNPAHIQLDTERIAYWVAQGAHVSSTVEHLLRRTRERAPSPTAGENAAQPAA